MLYTVIKLLKMDSNTILASNMNGIGGIAFVIIAILAFCLVGMLLVGPLAIICGLIGGKLDLAALILGILACVI